MMFAARPFMRQLKLRFLPFHTLNDRAKPEHDDGLASLFTKTGFCFIHIPKNGGTSVERIIYQNHSVKHRPWHELKALAPNDYETWVKFCVIREPIDRFLSAYDYLKSGGRNGIDAEIGRRYIRPYDDVNAFIQRFSDGRFRTDIMSYFHFQPQSHYVLSDDGQCMVNRVLSFENFSNDLAALLNISPTGIVHKNKTQGRRTTKNDLSATSIELLKHVYKRDFDLFSALDAQEQDLYLRKIF